METHDKHLAILLDIQRQIGDVKSETTGQSELLKSLDMRVAIQNGRVTENEKKIREINSLLDNWKGKLFVLMAIAVFVIGFLRDLFIDWLKII